MCYISDAIKKHLPMYKVNNATNRREDEMVKLFELLNSIPNLIIFTVRNSTNTHFFEPVDKQAQDEVKLIFFVKREMFFFLESREDLIDGQVIHIKKRLEKEPSCVICYEPIKHEVRFCHGCGASCCNPCLFKLCLHSMSDTSILCPICRACKITNNPFSN